MFLAACGGGGDGGGVAVAPAPPAPPPAAAALSCFNLALFETAGTSLRTVIDLSGASTGSQTIVATVGNPTTFNGTATRETVITATGTGAAGDVQLTSDIETRVYRLATSNGTVTEHGATSRAAITVSGNTGTSTGRTTSSVPFVDGRFTLSAGQTQLQTGSFTTATTTNGATSSQTTLISRNVRFVGIESVTVPAGTFNACRFEEAPTNAPSETTTSWVAVGNGATLRSVAVSSTGTQTSVARSIQLNGVSL